MVSMTSMYYHRCAQKKKLIRRLSYLLSSATGRSVTCCVQRCDHGIPWMIPISMWSFESGLRLRGSLSIVSRPVSTRSPTAKYPTTVCDGLVNQSSLLASSLSISALHCGILGSTWNVAISMFAGAKDLLPFWLAKWSVIVVPWWTAAQVWFPFATVHSGK